MEEELRRPIFSPVSYRKGLFCRTFLLGGERVALGGGYLSGSGRGLLRQLNENCLAPGMIVGCRPLGVSP